MIAPVAVPGLEFPVKAIFTLIAPGCAAFAHDIPNDVTVRACVKPAGNRLRLLLRAPMSVLRDINFPERPNGALDPECVDLFLREGASRWISDAMDIRRHRNVRGRPAPGETAHCANAALADFGPIVRHLRRCLRAHNRPVLPDYTDLIPGAAGAACSHCAAVYCGFPAAVRCARWNLRATPVWCGSIRAAGILPHPRWHGPSAFPVLSGHPVPVIWCPWQRHLPWPIP
jgi:hypothetical protein